ncbi:hypothetical protein [Allostreptomyces psammosilenae]|uniref:Uncharacterized protein n=1 Tax=Allostreptomyces psammosilenae TaxID=1892865 RepID=A0A852ZNY0_9ACTN|nr:hypothetical protein [Allostreptomyces psammosilenae]NYI03405.1 hypothetical protein [Allostreptomyces psammosilenae]
MQSMLDVSESVRSEIGDEETERLLAGNAVPDVYDCASCRTPGKTHQERTSTVLFVGEESAVLAFAHARCIPSQVVRVSDEQLADAVSAQAAAEALAEPTPGGAAQLAVTCGLILCGRETKPALVVEPTVPVARIGGPGDRDEFLDLLTEHGYHPVTDLNVPPAPLEGWSVLMAMGQLHAVLQPAAGGSSDAWWQAHRPMEVSEPWRNAANRDNEVLVYAAPVGSIGRQPREDLLREAMQNAVDKGLLVGGSMPLAGS